MARQNYAQSHFSTSLLLLTLTFEAKMDYKTISQASLPLLLWPGNKKDATASMHLLVETRELFSCLDAIAYIM